MCIRQLLVQGEKLSGQEAADKFKVSFRKLVMEKKLSLHQIFNCDETGPNFRLFPECTLAAGFKKTAAGRKISKDRVTLNLAMHQAPLNATTSYWQSETSQVFQKN